MDTVRGVTIRYRLALGLLALLSGGAWAILQRTVRAQENFAAVLNLSGRQRMLAKHIALTALRMAQTRDPIFRDSQRRELRSAIQAMAQAHQGLVSGDLAGTLSPRLKAMYFEAPLLIDSKVRNYLAEARELAGLADYDIDRDVFTLQNVVEAGSTRLIDSLDSVVLAYQRESEENTRLLRRLELWVLAVTLLVLCLEALFIFRPMARRVELKTRELEELNASLERRVAERTEAAEEASRAKSEFLARISHEIRTPMNAILGMTELLSETKLDDEQRRFTRVLTSGGKTLLNLIDAILDLSKIEAGRLELERSEFDPEELVNETAEVMEVSARRKGLRFERRFSGLPRRVVGDPKRLQEILINLVGNAIKFTPKGSVLLEAEADPARPGFLFFSVEDTGVGVAEESLEAIFEPFTQADAGVAARHGGTGLGLSISKKLAELMGGRITVSSKPGEGSRFSVAIPVGVPRPAGAAPAEPAATAADFPRPLDILVADDSEDNRLLLERYLKSHRVDAVGDGRAAVSRVKAGRFDLVLMDMRMPVLDGYEAVKGIRDWEKAEGRSPVPIIALTAGALKEERERSLRAGCTAYLSKPVRKAALIEAMRQAVRL